jgi:hypothetical protein
MWNALPVVVFIVRWTVVVSLSFFDSFSTFITSDSFGAYFIIYLKAFWRVIIYPDLRWVTNIFGSKTFKYVFSSYQFRPNISLKASTSFSLRGFWFVGRKFWKDTQNSELKSEHLALVGDIEHVLDFKNWEISELHLPIFQILKLHLKVFEASIIKI